MKCEDIRTRQQGDTPFFPNMLNNGKVEVCLKEDVDRLLDEKDAEIEKWKKEFEHDARFISCRMCEEKFKKYINELKAEIESLKANHDIEMVDAGMRERRLRRALYKACANWADRTRLICSVFGSSAPMIRWKRMKDKCRAKAEQYR